MNKMTLVVAAGAALACAGLVTGGQSFGQTPGGQPIGTGGGEAPGDELVERGIGERPDDLSGGIGEHSPAPRRPGSFGAPDSISEPGYSGHVGSVGQTSDGTGDRAPNPQRPVDHVVTELQPTTYGAQSPSRTCRQDVDNSGRIGFQDLLAILDGWGVCSETDGTDMGVGAQPEPCKPDVNLDGFVDFQDVLQVLSAWDATCERLVAVP